MGYGYESKNWPVLLKLFPKTIEEFELEYVKNINIPSNK